MSRTPSSLRILFVSLLIAIFALSVAFVYVFALDGSISDDESKAFTVTAIFAVMFILLNAIMLTVGYMILKKAKLRSAARCVSCNAIMDTNARTCPECNAAQPDTYLEPKERNERIIKKK